MDPIIPDQFMTGIDSAFYEPLPCWSLLQLRRIAFFVGQSQCIADTFLRLISCPGGFQ